MNNKSLLQIDKAYKDIQTILEKARSKSFKVVNTAMVQAYWHIGKVIVEEEQRGKQRAEYGKALLEGLSEKLSRDYGEGFNITNLKYMRQFYLAFPIRHAPRGELTWTHYRLLLKIEKAEAREFYVNEPIGILLCARKNDAVVKFTLPEGQKQIFVSKYVPYLPTEDELKAELLREKELVEMEFKLKRGIS